MKTTLAIYEALLQAQIPQLAARGVAEALERDMEALLATKTDLRLLSSEMARQFEKVWRNFDAMERRFERIDERFEQMDKRFEQIDKRFAAIDARMRELLDQNFARAMDERFHSVELRLTVKLGSIMVASLTALAAIVKFV
ncbi:MAG TPA: hypothetical protein P5528_00470 [Steroidobacteraceae bacterium]|nr:hypothetical protein [Steroidobacteraceae bacterium]HRX87892.1 hypothetical protein [Steroidobacteraceae bacterium]